MYAHLGLSELITTSYAEFHLEAICLMRVLHFQLQPVFIIQLEKNGNTGVSTLKLELITVSHRPMQQTTAVDTINTAINISLLLARM